MIAGIIPSAESGDDIVARALCLIRAHLGMDVAYVDGDQARQALAGAIVGFARDIGSQLIAEGVETASELATLRTLGIELAQGYYLGRPMPLAVATASLAYDPGRAAA